MGKNEMSTPKANVARSPKSPSTRLLDLLAGWSAFVSADEENELHDSHLPSDAIAELYQLAGTQCEAWEKLTPEGEEAAVREFLAQRVVPLLLAGEEQLHSRTQAA
jgi:hypothetical protein